MEDTIAAIATPVGAGAIGIIRISGPQSLVIADTVFRARNGKPSDWPTQTIHLGEIIDGNALVDQVLLTVMRAPKTYTAEDIVEINCHGGLLTTRRILALCLQHGARLAEPGEFTRRAFLNGRMDLSQAESVMDLISAKTERARTAAMTCLGGVFAAQIQTQREHLLQVAAHIEALIDFPEEDLPPASRQELILKLQTVSSELNRLLATRDEGKILRQGISIAIIGRPNAGKSSLMNALLGEERAIVTPIAGTTRDTIEDHASINGIPIRLIDTAGIRSARGTIEIKGINNSRKALECSDLLLHVIDQSKPFSKQDAELIRQYEHRKSVLILNKADLSRKLRLPENHSGVTVAVSCVTLAGLDELKRTIEEHILNGIEAGAHRHVAVNERQGASLFRAAQEIASAQTAIQLHYELEIAAHYLRSGIIALGEISGSTYTEDLLDRIFSTFCIGK